MLCIKNYVIFGLNFSYMYTQKTLLIIRLA